MPARGTVDVLSEKSRASFKDRDKGVACAIAIDPRDGYGVSCSQRAACDPVVLEQWTTSASLVLAGQRIH